MANRMLILVILLAAALRLGLLCSAWDHPLSVATPDTADYVVLSDSLMTGSFERHNQPEIFRTPGYPLFLMIGTLVDQGDWWHLVLIVQVLLDVLLVYLTYLLGCMLFNQRTGLWAALFQATSAIAVASSMRILSDSLFAMLLTLAILLFVHHWKFARWWSLAACAGVLGAACYVRPVGQVFLVILAAALLVRAIYLLRKKQQAKNEASLPVPISAKTALAGLAMYVAVAVAVVGPWVVRNSMQADYVGFSSFATDSAYFFAVPEVLTATRGDIESAQAREYVKKLDAQDESHYAHRTPGQAVAFRSRYTVSMIYEHPCLYARKHLRGVVGFFLPGATDVLEVAGLTTGQRGTSDVLRKQGLLAAARNYFGGENIPPSKAAVIWTVAGTVIGITLLQYLGVLIFLFRFARSVPALVWLLLGLIVVASLLSGPFGFPRYQAMVVPLISLFAAAGWARLRSQH